MSTAEPGRRWLPAPIYLLAVATFVVGTDKDLLVGILPQLSADLDASPELVVQLATVFALTYASPPRCWPSVSPAGRGGD